MDVFRRNLQKIFKNTIWFISNKHIMPFIGPRSLFYKIFTPDTGWSTPDSYNMDWGQGAGPGAYTCTQRGGGTADSSPRSGNTGGHLDMEDEEETSEEEEELDKQSYRLRPEPGASPPQVSVGSSFLW